MIHGRECREVHDILQEALDYICGDPGRPSQAELKASLIRAQELVRKGIPPGPEAPPTGLPPIYA